MANDPTSSASKDQGRKAGMLSALAGIFGNKSNSSGSPSGQPDFDSVVRRSYLAIEKHKIIYCPIEKNACTYFKRLLLNHSECAEEYAVSGLESHTFINRRRKPLLDDVSKLNRGDYLRFVVVREPIGRVVSAYLNKFVLNQNFRWAIDAAEKYKQIDPSFSGDCDTLTFNQFVQMLVAHQDWELDVHWRPQAAFFEPVVECFDWIVPMDRVPDFVPILEEQIGSPIALEKTHNQNFYQPYSDVDPPMCDWTPWRLRELQTYPDAGTLAAGRVGEQLAERYRRDTELWSLANSRFEQALRAAR